jgi:hypothetical protein
MSNPVSELNDPKASVETHLPAEVPSDIAVPAEIQALLGEPPLLANEEPSDYYALLVLLARDVKPTGVIEWLWVRDVADLTWDVMRYRRVKAAFFNQHFRFALERDRQAPQRRKAHLAALDAQLARYEGRPAACVEANGGKDGPIDPTTKEEVDANVEEPDSRTYESFFYNEHFWEALEKMQTSAEFRRNNTLREIEHRRSALGRALRQSADRVIEAEVLRAPLAA